MAGIRRQKKLYSRPMKPYDSERIREENSVSKKYGLKNKREIWKAEAKVTRLRGLAKKLITAPLEEQEKFISKLIEMGFLNPESNKIDSVLEMKKEDYLNRRLQTVVYKKGIAKSLKHARQLVTHKYIRVGNRVINIPSYIVNVGEEKAVSVVASKPKGEAKAVLTEEKNA